MKLNLRVPTALTIIIILLSFLKSESVHAQVELKFGDYLSREYIEKLQKTQSPLSAEGAHTINLLVVEKQDNEISVMPILNFHEGGPTFRLKKSGKAELENNAGLNISKYRLQALSNHKLSFAMNKPQTDEYVYVNNVQELISRICIAGQYVDDKGRKFVFESNGTVKTPDGIMKITIGVDHIPYRFDYFEDSKNHQVYKFVRNKCKLGIYRVLDAEENQHGNDGSHVASYLSLQMVNCESK